MDTVYAFAVTSQPTTHDSASMLISRINSALHQTNCGTKIANIPGENGKAEYYGYCYSTDKKSLDDMRCRLPTVLSGVIFEPSEISSGLMSDPWFSSMYRM